jgi:hypothetical protein
MKVDKISHKGSEQGSCYAVVTAAVFCEFFLAYACNTTYS